MAEPTCIDLRPWAKASRYRWRYEESYHAEKPENRGDGRWYVEVMCRYGLIYPYGRETLLVYCNRGVKRHVAGFGFERHQTDGDAEVFKFPADRLDEVAAILKPRRRRTLDPDRAQAIGKATAYGAQSTENGQESTQSHDEGQGLGKRYLRAVFSACSWRSGTRITPNGKADDDRARSYQARHFHPDP